MNHNRLWLRSILSDIQTRSGVILLLLRKKIRAYANYVATTSFREGIHEILLLMTNYNNLVIMCAEAVP